MPQTINNFPVMQKECSTCPFKKNEDGKNQNPKLVARIQQQVLQESSQICHHPRLSGKDETHLCRGARNFQLQIFHRIGFLEAPTDVAWKAKNQSLTSTK